jgi:RNA polymerase sigma-70 factor, ECF subfamily
MTTMTIPATSASAHHLGGAAADATPGLASVARGRSACVAERGRVMKCPEGVGAPAVDPDGPLVERLRRQEAGAAEALVAVYGERVYRLAIRITGDSSDAEEVVQDALWAVMRKIDTFRGAAAFSSWLYRITANAAYQKLRGRRTKGNAVSWDHLAPSFDENGRFAEPVLDWSTRAQDPAIQGELQSVLSAAIADLPAAYHAPFLLYEADGLSHLEIAEALQVSASAVKSRVHRARIFLRKRLADYIDGTLMGSYQSPEGRMGWAGRHLARSRARERRPSSCHRSTSTACG